MGFGEMAGANLGLLPGNYRLTIPFPFLLTELFQLLVLMPWACPWSILGDAEWRRVGYIFAAGLGLILHPWLGVECWRWLRWGRWDTGPACRVCVCVSPRGSPSALRGHSMAPLCAVSLAELCREVRLGMAVPGTPPPRGRQGCLLPPHLPRLGCRLRWR